MANQLIDYTEATARLTALRDAEARLMHKSTSDGTKRNDRDVKAVYEAVSACAPSDSEKRQLVRRIIDKIVIERIDSARGVQHYQFDIKIIFA